MYNEFSPRRHYCQCATGHKYLAFNPIWTANWEPGIFFWGELLKLLEKQLTADRAMAQIL